MPSDESCDPGRTRVIQSSGALSMVPGCSVVALLGSVDVFERVSRGMIAVIPLENTLAGSVAEHFDLLLTHRAFIRSEFRLRIVHNLIAPRGVKFKDIRHVFHIRWLSNSAETCFAKIAASKQFLSTTPRKCQASGGEQN